MESQVRVERRIVTVLFADLVGFTALSETMDPEDMAAVQGAYFAQVRETIGRYNGALEKFIGDAAMAVFGIPRARDDDAERAVRAGLALTRAVEQLAPRIGLDEGKLLVRVGVSMGEVAYGEAEPGVWRVTGDTVNSASRLQAAAAPNTVLIGETTALAVEDAIELEPAGKLALKGKAEPVAAWTAKSVRAMRSRDQAMGQLRAPMLGRGSELARLRDAVAAASRGARLRWLIVAPPGVGKTRLLEEFVLDALHASVVLRARCRADVVGPYQPVAQLLAGGLAYAGFEVDAVTSGGAGALDDAHSFIAERVGSASASPARADVVAREAMNVLWPLSSETVGGAPGDREARFDAWLTALDALTLPGLQVVVAEDVHWAGGDFLAFLDYLTDPIDPSPAGGRLVVVTGRPALLERAPGWTADRPEHGRCVLDLQPLSGVYSKELVRALVGDAVPDELLTQIAHRSDGNPLFIEEILRSWVSVGVLVPVDGRWEMTEAANVHLPATLQAVYAGQIDDLPPGARDVARKASIAGRRFPLAALEPLAVRDGVEGVEILRRRALISGPEVDPFAGETYAYRHALLRDAGYASLARAERARLHVRLARWIEEFARERTTPVAEVIGSHYESALEQAPTLASEIDGLPRSELQRLGAGWLERGGAAALSLAAHDAARSLFKRALDLTEADAVIDRARRWQRLGDATAYAGDMDEGGRAIEEAMSLYRAAMDHFGLPSKARCAAREGYARAALALGMVWTQQLRFEDAATLADEGLRAIGERDDLDTARLLYLRAHSHTMFALRPEIRGELERALALAAEHGDAELELELTEALHDLLVEEGAVGLDEMRRHNRRVIELASGLARWQTVARRLRMDAGTLIDDRTSLARPILDEAAEVADARGLREELVWVDYSRSEAGFASGDWDWAWEAALRALDEAERNAYHRAAIRTWFVLVPIALARGRRDILERTRLWFDRHAAIIPHSPYGNLMRGAIEVRLAAAELGTSEGPALGEVIGVWGEAEVFGSVWDACEIVTRQWLTRGAFDDVRTWLDAMAKWHAHPVTSELGKGTHALIESRLHIAESRPEAAVEAARLAEQRFRVGPAPWWLAKAIRVLESLSRASPDLLAEAQRIDVALGVAKRREL